MDMIVDALAYVTQTGVIAALMNIGLWSYAGALAVKRERRQALLIAILAIVAAFVASDVIVLLAYLAAPDVLLLRLLIGFALGLQMLAAIATIVTLKGRER
jgi:MFS family permease